MRLLERDDAGEFNLTKDLIDQDKIPPYAILSHTWVADEEVVLEELKNGTGKGKPGFHKIKFCGDQAERDGLRHFWRLSQTEPHPEQIQQAHEPHPEQIQQAHELALSQREPA
ncbi:hypothetical protein EG328_004125 [Venturia inaequalis]|uniref:Uncharacterized protein n=1 Tax=Venturia inaequalis TaxID=5025 RepID=A0A8H3Z8F2_VENIN|nr:hypothetical protein EG328_004125 [Venturia inaequalis]